MFYYAHPILVLINRVAIFIVFCSVSRLGNGDDLDLWRVISTTAFLYLILWYTMCSYYCDHTHMQKFPMKVWVVQPIVYAEVMALSVLLMDSQSRKTIVLDTGIFFHDTLRSFLADSGDGNKTTKQRTHHDDKNCRCDGLTKNDIAVQQQLQQSVQMIAKFLSFATILIIILILCMLAMLIKIISE
jgi:hypothetical protein